MIKQILVGLDGSTFSDAAVKYAIDLARNHDANILGLAVMDTEGVEAAYHTARPLGAGSADASLHQKQLDEERRRAEGILNEFKKICSSEGARHETRLGDGDPASEILNASILSDVLLMGKMTRFAFGLEENEFCETCEEVLAHSFRPTILTAENFKPVKKVMIAADFHRLSDRLLFNYVHLNPYPKGEVHLVHAVSGHDSDREVPEDLLKYLELHGINVVSKILHGDHVGQAIINYASTEEIDMVVIGVHTLSKVWSALVGSTARYVIENLDIPVYTQT